MSGPLEGTFSVYAAGNNFHPGDSETCKMCVIKFVNVIIMSVQNHFMCREELVWAPASKSASKSSSSGYHVTSNALYDLLW